MAKKTAPAARNAGILPVVFGKVFDLLLTCPNLC
jgi:hypothetical protein